jgi:hypothetical protein
MHKGKITMLGRIMAGSQAVIAHNDAGHALFVAYHPPDLQLSQLIIDYCHKVVRATGTSVFISDRAVNAVALAREFARQAWGVLCMLDDHEHHGLASFEATLEETVADGTKVYSGPWHVPSPDDPREFVIVEPPEGKTLVYWGTPQVQEVIEPREWPRVYRARNEIQENRFKRMSDHGALTINYGRKKVIGVDRHQQRKRVQRTPSLESAQQRVARKAAAFHVQQAKVAESQTKGHGTRLEQRQRALTVVEQEFKDAQHQRGKIAEHIAALGPPGERADRDFRKQTIMTIRTLLLENALNAFMGALLGILQTKGSLERVFSLLFARSGVRIETSSQVVYWVNTAGLSAPNRLLLAEIAEGLWVMGLQAQGTPMRVCLRDMPP